LDKGRVSSEHVFKPDITDNSLTTIIPFNTNHTADTFANLDSKVSDGGLIVTLEPGTDKIQGAIDALPASGGIVRLKVGTHTITSVVTISKSNVSIIGEGYSTILDVTGGTGAFESTAGADDLFFANFKVDLNSASGSLIGIEWNDRGQRVVSNVRFENVLGANTAFIQQTAPASILERQDRILNVNGIVTAGSVTTGIDLPINRAVISNCRIEGCTTGIDFDARGSVVGCFVKSCVTGIEAGQFGEVFGCEVLQCTSKGINSTFGVMTIGNCLIDTCPIGIEVPSQTVISGCNVRGSTTVAILATGQNTTITGCHIGSSNIAIEVTGTGFVSVTGCNIILKNGTDFRGIKISADFCTVAGCVIEGQAITSSTLIGILVDSSGSACNIDGCTIRNFTNGIGISVGLTHTDVSISDCTIDKVDDGILIATTADRAKINSCHLRNLGGNGIELNGPEDCEVMGNHLTAITGTEILETGSADKNFVEGNMLPGGTVTLIGATTVSLGNLT